MRTLVLFALFSVAAAKPTPGIISPWGAPSISSVGLYHQPAAAVVAQPSYAVAQQSYAVAQPSYAVAQPTYTVAQPVVHAAPAVAIAKPAAATSYSSFQQIVHPVHVAQPLVHAPVVHAPVVHAQPFIQQVAQPVQLVHQPVVQTIAQPLVGHVGHGW